MVLLHRRPQYKYLWTICESAQTESSENKFYIEWLLILYFQSACSSNTALEMSVEFRKQPYTVGLKSYKRNRPLSGRSVEWTFIPPPTMQI
jgi:hypothetical protein